MESLTQNDIPKWLKSSSFAKSLTSEHKKNEIFEIPNKFYIKSDKINEEDNEKFLKVYNASIFWGLDKYPDSIYDFLLNYENVKSLLKFMKKNEFDRDMIDLYDKLRINFKFYKESNENPNYIDFYFEFYDYKTLIYRFNFFIFIGETEIRFRNGDNYIKMRDDFFSLGESIKNDEYFEIKFKGSDIDSGTHEFRISYEDNILCFNTDTCLFNFKINELNKKKIYHEFVKVHDDLEEIRDTFNFENRLEEYIYD